MIYLKPINELSEKETLDLVEILNNDIKLQKSLERDPEKISSDQFISHNEEWRKKNNAKMFGIILDDAAIGMISLSHINNQDKKAKIGYWITSKYWSQGHASDAFKQTLNIAKETGIKFISCSIPKDNKASKKIWEKFGASFEEKDDKIMPLINL